MKQSLILATLLLSVASCVGDVGPDETFDELEPQVFGGIAEPDFLHPWVVNIGAGCHGVLIDPEWVLTAGHCVDGGNPQIFVLRTAPDGTTFSQTVSIGAKFFAPGYVFDAFDPQHDLALVRLGTRLTPSRLVQMAGLPAAAPVLGQQGTIASQKHGGAGSVGKLQIMRAPVTAPGTCTPREGDFCIQSPSASLCGGDSGSGFVSIVNGRATALGIASTSNASIACNTVNDPATMVDVFAHRQWITQTMNLSSFQIDGTARVRWSGRASHGTLQMTCTNGLLDTSFSTFGPMIVAGAQVGVFCPFLPVMDNHARATCRIDAAEPAKITSVVHRVFDQAGTLLRSNTITVNGKLFSASNTARLGEVDEYTCQVASN